MQERHQGYRAVAWAAGAATVRAMPAALDSLTATIRGRRTVKAFTGAPIASDVLSQCLDLARWAPNHRLHQPWRFAVLDQAAIARLALFLRSRDDIAAVPDAIKGPAKLAKLLDHLPSLGAIIQVTWVRDADPTIDLEDHAAAAAAVEHILLGVHAAGLGGFWSSSAALAHPETLRWCGCDVQREAFLGSLWLGHPQHIPEPSPRRPLSEVARWL